VSDQGLIGQNYTPPDLLAKITGRAKYAEDFRAEGMLFAKLLLSPMPHARVRRLDVRAALATPGVAAVLTAEDLPAPEVGTEAGLTNEPLYAGEPILAVAAADETTAAEAIERIQIELEPLPFVLDPLESLRPGGPNARPEGNVLVPGDKGFAFATFKWTEAQFAEAREGRLPMGDVPDTWTVGDVEAGFAAAALTLDETVVHQSLSHHCLEPRSTLAYWQNGKLYVFGSTQSTARTVPAIAGWVGIDPADVVFVSEYTGGGFGSKISGSLQMRIPALLAKKAGRPVMLRVTRAEEHDYGRARPGCLARIRMGFRKDGRLAALDLFIVQDNGPYGRQGDHLTAASLASLVYQPEAMRFRGISVLTNTPPKGAQRAPGGEQINLMIEPLLDKAARALGVDRVAIRQINAPTMNAAFGPPPQKPGAPRASVTSCFVKEAWEKATALFGWDEKKALSGRRRGTKVTGIGVGQGAYSSGSIGYDGIVLIKPDGKVYIHQGLGNLGTGSFADTARVVADVLKVPWERCEIVWGDTGKHLPWSSVQAGSQSTHAHTRANYVAAMDARRKLQEIAARDLGGSPEEYEVEAERVYRKGSPSRSLTFAQAAARATALGGKYDGHEAPDDINAMTARSVKALAGQGLLGVAKDTLPRQGSTYSFAVAFARVEVDVETAQVDLVEYVVVPDCGTVVHPRSLGGQLYGGAVLGFGIARSSKWVYDPRWGQAMTRTLYTSKPPSFLDVPLEFRWEAVGAPDPFNPVGAKGIGEPPVGAGASALASALADAVGRNFNRTPITAEMILAALENRPQPYGPLAMHV
jgi:CO/xanthine dehydrogenase Mo-binding subunit